MHTDKPGRISAELFAHDYIPEFRKAIQAFKNNALVEALVTKVSPYAVYITLYGGKIQSKLPIKDNQLNHLKEGDNLLVRITHLSNSRIVVEMKGEK
ncbi:MAG: hypothetical protein ACTHLE_03360 [Agriterribacter sp.]